MSVLDASALIEVILVTRRGRRLMDELDGAENSLDIPHLADAEVVQVLRQYARAGIVQEDTAAGALAAYRLLDLNRHSHDPLLTRVWELRHNLTAYDALYVALAEALNAELITCDRKLAQAPGLRARIRLIAAD